MKLPLLCIAISIGLVATEAPNYDDLIASLMTTDMTPNTGPERPDTVYKPGTPGGQWTEEDIEITKYKVKGCRSKTVHI